MKADSERSAFDRAGSFLFGAHVVILLSLIVFVLAMLAQTSDPLERGYLLIPVWAGVGYVFVASVVAALLYRRRRPILSRMFFGAAAVAALGGAVTIALHLWIKTGLPEQPHHAADQAALAASMNSRIR